jgi:hypothetical protein
MEVLMKKHQNDRGNPLTVNAVCQRVLKSMREALTQESKKWTPFEGVPVSVSVAELRRQEVPG